MCVLRRYAYTFMGQCKWLCIYLLYHSSCPVILSLISYFHISYQSILSELNDDGKLDTARVLHNNKNFPAFSSIEELLSYPDDDPTGIRHQFENFITAKNLVYPVILIRDDIFHHTEAVKELKKLVSQLLGEEEYDILSILNERGYDQPKSHSLESIMDSELKNQFIRRFEDIHDTFQSQPLIRLLKPDSNTGLIEGSR